MNQFIKIKESIHKNQRINLPILSPNIYEYDFNKHIVFTFDKSKIKDIRNFRKRLPRKLMWLLRPPLPVTSNQMEAIFFNHKFGKDYDIDEKTLEREPWRLESSFNEKLEDYRQKLIVLLSGWGVIPNYYTMREINMYKPNSLQQEFTLKTIDMHGGGSPKIWHYFSLPKFLGFIQSKTIRFSRPSVFTDPFESKTNKLTRAHQTEIALRQITHEYNIAVINEEDEFISINSIWANKLKTDSSGKIIETELSSFEELPIELRSLAENRLDSINDSFLINCWHENELESDAMWGIYSDRMFGIAIASTPEKVREAFADSNVKVQVTPIEYHDLHEDDKIFDSLPVGYKHKAFIHEREYRIYLTNYPYP